MSNIRQTILIRKDLNLPVGLLAAQVAHLHMESIRYNLNKYFEEGAKFEDNHICLESNYSEWLKAPYIFVHGVPNAETLGYYLEIADRNKIEKTNWRDTVFLNVSETQRIVLKDVLIGAVLGPEDSDKIKLVIGDLPLL